MVIEVGGVDLAGRVWRYHNVGVETKTEKIPYQSRIFDTDSNTAQSRLFSIPIPILMLLFHQMKKLNFR